ncbi:VWA domain-containing protein [Mycolicibacterium mucogenicum]|uniref:nitric oxide reductase activation protein NorD n=1 Tax=Mycolicibacterium mucogenicum TaxID=56689 RepID=UPI00226A6470|nr:VWA domain-containing protein [Mycolicibacterium mucogenicum]MCX8560783.1 VWA domain-containing protein [Mycolicibacterium mucogenicum]
MTDSAGPQQFRLLATHVAGRPVDIAEARGGESAHTDGHVIYVSAGPVARQRSEMLLQSAMLGAGSLDASNAKALRGRPAIARRYLALEGRRVLADLARELPLAVELGAGEPITADSDESLRIAKGRRTVDDAPDWFGVIKPSRLLAAPVGPGARPTDKDLQLKFEVPDVLEDLDEEESDGEAEDSADSKILKLFEAPMASRTMSDFLSKLFGSSKSKGQDNAGAEMQIGSVRRVGTAGPDARPLPTQIRFTDDGRPGATLGVGGALHPEWDVFAGRYKEDWCRVIDFPLTAAADVAAAGVPHDDILRRRLSRIGLGPKILRGRADGDELDIEALIDLFVDLRSGFSPPEHVYLEQRKLSRNLGVLILVDASGSATETDAGGLAVHEHQRRAAATMAAVLEELGDRVAVYGFRSQGRHAVHLPAIKPFGQRFGAVGRARLNQLEPSGYTRLGAAIRGAGEILKEQAGTPNRLLLVLSDGFPYDDGYEGRYAEADAHKALEELRVDGVACLCLSIGGAGETDALERVFGSASYASAGTLAELSPRMDELFLSSLRELAAPKPAGS